jgi:2-dehydro-3-deoxyphosphogluconate aldolase/(4S)-4-hydroxy-2-oxoglutarate aldolase
MIQAMISENWLNKLRQHRAIAVIRAATPELGRHQAQAVAEGGLRIVEITWNTDGAAELIQQLRWELPHCIIGTGTILDQTALKQAIAAGVQFAFSPHVNVPLIQAAVAAGIPIIPGALTPTEIVTAWQAGATCVKIFPCQAVGYAAYIKGLQGPLGQIPMIPTGGVTIDNAREFIQAGAIAVGLAGDLFPSSLIAAQDWSAIAQRSQTLVTSLRSVSNSSPN